MNSLEKIFSVKNEDYYKVVRIFGIKVLKFLNNKKMLKELKDDLNKIKTLSERSIRRPEGKKKLFDESYILPNKFYDYLNLDITDDYLELIKGLDKESVLNVQKVLNRIQNLQKNNSNICFLTDDDFKEYYSYISNFQRAVVQLNENTWAFEDYLLPSDTFDVSVFYFKHHLDKFKNIDFSKDIIDAGASMGDSALFLSRLANANIYSFEPTSELFTLINKTIELNKLTNVIPIQKGLLDKEAEQNIYLAGKFGRSTTINEFRNEGTNAELVKFTTIDKFVKENNLKIGLIKADVEGAEPLLLKGAIETIKTQKPALIISIYHGAEDFFKIKPMLDSLNLGYQFKITKPSMTNMFLETCLLAEVIEE